MSQECGSCFYFKPARHPSGRVNKKHYGQCDYPVEWPTLPLSYKTTELPQRKVMWFNSNAEECRCYQKNL